MQAADIQPGKIYALREPPRPLGPMRRVRVQERVRKGGRWRIEFLDEPTVGLVDYTASRNIIVPWGQRRALVRDEERAVRLTEVSDREYPGNNHPIETAVMWVLDSSGEAAAGSIGGTLGMSRDCWDRLLARAGLDEIPDAHHVVYQDRHGDVHAPWPTVLTLAQAFAASEPETVLSNVDYHEQMLSLEARDPAHRDTYRYLQAQRPAFALARSWAGFDLALKERDDEIERLRRIIERSMSDLRRAGQDDLAHRMQTMLTGR